MVTLSGKRWGMIAVTGQFRLGLRKAFIGMLTATRN
jgi:hypothetical protein